VVEKGPGSRFYDGSLEVTPISNLLSTRQLAGVGPLFFPLTGFLNTTLSILLGDCSPPPRPPIRANSTKWNYLLSSSLFFSRRGVFQLSFFVFFLSLLLSRSIPLLSEKKAAPSIKVFVQCLFLRETNRENRSLFLQVFSLLLFFPFKTETTNVLSFDLDKP